MTKINSKGKALQTQFEIVLPRVGRDTLFNNTDYGFFMIDSDETLHNYQELWMSRTDQILIEKIRQKKLADKEADHELIDLYDRIIQQVNQYFKLYKIRKFNERLQNSQEAFRSLHLYGSDKEENKFEILQRVLVGLGANASRTDLSRISVQSRFGQILLSSGIVLQGDTSIIYQSPSGLFERSVRLSSL